MAKPNPGYILTDGKGLDVLDPNSANTSLDLNQDKQLIAYFKTDPTYNPDDFPLIDQLGIFNLRVTTADILKGSVSGSGVFGTGWAEIKAFPQKGYDFVKWEGSGIEDEYALNTYVFLSQDTVVEALFEPVPAVTGSEKLASSWWQSDWFEPTGTLTVTGFIRPNWDGCVFLNKLNLIQCGFGSIKSELGFGLEKMYSRISIIIN